MSAATGAATTSATQRLAGDLAANLVGRFAMPDARVWLFGPGFDPAAGPAASASASGHAYDGGLDAAAVAALAVTAAPHAELVASTAHDARFLGRLPGKAYVGLPLGSAGYVEAYRATPIELALFSELGAFVERHAAAIVSAQATQSLESPRRGTILIADDDPVVRAMLRRVLEPQGFRVLTVGDGDEACAAAVRDHPDLVLIDWQMPRMDGRAATCKLKADPKTRAIPIVMLTTRSQTEDKVAALEAGVQDFLVKPAEPRELIARIEQHLRWRRLLSAEEALTERPAAAPEPLELPHVEAEASELWARAIEAQALGKLREALALFIAEAKRCDAEARFARAALAYRSASAASGRLGNADLADKFLRLAGKMYLSWAESASEPKAIEEAYLAAARCFIIAGNVQLAKKSVDMATSIRSVLADDAPGALAG